MAKDLFHNLVRTALENDGWTITHDPYTITFGERRVMIDLGAEKLILAEKNAQKIAIEVKSFTGISLINELHQTVGQLDFYALLLEKESDNRILYLAMPADAYNELTLEPIVVEYLERHQVKIIIYETNQPTITKWIE
ncbi:MAG: element excision factor XisH family protein [Saprospiraceae bacterium]